MDNIELWLIGGFFVIIVGLLISGKFSAIFTKDKLKIKAGQETAYLLKSATMKQRLLAAKERNEGIEFGAACEKLGVSK